MVLEKAIQKTKDKLRSAMSQTVRVKLVHGQKVTEAEMPAFNSFGQLKVWGWKNPQATLGG
jgi:hypothetical protein